MPLAFTQEDLLILFNLVKNSEDGLLHKSWICSDTVSDWKVIKVLKSFWMTTS